MVLAALAALLALPASASALLAARFHRGLAADSLGHKDFELMQEAGVDNVRLPMFWSGVEGTSPLVAQPDWSTFDKEVELAAEDDVRISPSSGDRRNGSAAEPVECCR